MNKFYISGVWLDGQTIKGYAVHSQNPTSISRATKYTKAEAIALVESANNEVYTWLWNYANAKFVTGARVDVVNGQDGKYLRSLADSSRRDNLLHLIDFDWISGF